MASLPPVRNTVAVVDPNSPQHAIAPNADGSINVTTSTGTTATPSVTVGIESTLQNPLTVTAASAYASGNVVGTLQSISAARVAAGSGLIQSVMANSKSAQTAQLDVVFFNANPTNSTFTDKTALAVNTADFDKVLGVVHVTDWTSLGTPSVGQAQNLAIPFALASGTSLWFVCVTRGTPTFTATTDVSVGVRVVQN